MDIENYTDKSVIWEEFVTFDSANDPKPKVEAYKYLLSLMPPNPNKGIDFIENREGNIVQEPEKKEPEKKPRENLSGKKFDGEAKVVFKGKEIFAGIVTLQSGGKTFVQLTDICDLLGLKYRFDNSTKTVEILQ